MSDYEQLREKFTESSVIFSVGIREEFAEAGNLPDAAHIMIKTHSPISFWFTASGEYIGAYLPYEAPLFRRESRDSHQEKPLGMYYVQSEWTRFPVRPIPLNRKRSNDVYTCESFSLTAEQAVKTRRLEDYVFPIVRRDIPTDAAYTQADWVRDKDDNACS